MSGRRSVWYLLIINLSISCLLVVVAFVAGKTVSTAQSYMLYDNCIQVIIDAGHGGVDGGAVSCTGVSESILNLQIAQRLDDFMRLFGINTKMIRESNISLDTKGDTIAARKVSDLRNRVTVVNSFENALLISIHQNYFTNKKYDGAQIFYSETANSYKFAELMQTRFNQTTDSTVKRKAKKAEGIYLLDNIKNPGILIECGFLSNPEEEAKLRNADYQKLICAIITAETASYINTFRVA